MSERKFYIARNDLSPALEVIPTDGNGNTIPIGVDDTVVFNLTTQNGSEIVVDRAPAEVVDGNLRYQWVPGDTDVAGRFYGEFEWLNGSLPVTFPNHQAGRLIVEIMADIA